MGSDHREEEESEVLFSPHGLHPLLVQEGTPDEHPRRRPPEDLPAVRGRAPRYTTLYDLAKSVPLYSSCAFNRASGETSVGFTWMYEPQNQVVLSDYGGRSSYERGQLNPDEHQVVPEDKAATYTLTNADAPAKVFSCGPPSWRRSGMRYTFPSFGVYGLDDIGGNSVVEVTSRRLEALICREMLVELTAFFGITAYLKCDCLAGLGS
ncbi:hypothetical protein SKAU_G00367230 [Synaphobranchus kaupii]|uniref:Uncharacterized protein n=1 Tax=Synaphobranchus kaupii TaxID=118154 RepID=A0A9Q1IFF9_SYNKA|nr:hypothetical protein SKAU_G00367230 [Synaphobranchus kaupii]